MPAGTHAEPLHPLFYLRYDAFEEPVSRSDGHPNAGLAEAQALQASDGAGDRRQDNEQHDVALEAFLVAVRNPVKKQNKKNENKNDNTKKKRK